jgi:hypothetical protein
MRVYVLAKHTLGSKCILLVQRTTGAVALSASLVLFLSIIFIRFLDS